MSDNRITEIEDNPYNAVEIEPDARPARDGYQLRLKLYCFLLLFVFLISVSIVVWLSIYSKYAGYDIAFLAIRWFYVLLFIWGGYLFFVVLDFTVFAVNKEIRGQKAIREKAIWDQQWS